MGLDIRWPIGLMFSIIGAILVVYGAVTSSGEAAQMYQRSLGMNVNLGWGILLLIFGVLMLVSAKVAAAKKPKG